MLRTLICSVSFVAGCFPALARDVKGEPGFPNYSRISLLLAQAGKAFGTYENAVKLGALELGGSQMAKPGREALGAARTLLSELDRPLWLQATVELFKRWRCEATPVNSGPVAAVPEIGADFGSGGTGGSPKRLKKAVKHYKSASQALKSNDIDRAVAEYRKALEEDPDEPYWHLALAMALKQKGERQAILDDYEVARKLAPDDEALRRAYDSLLTPAPRDQPDAGGVEGGAIDAIHKVGPGVSPPRCAYCPDPPYTNKARAAWYSGTCLLQIIVNRLGDVVNVRVVKPLGLGLDENAVNTIRTWKFSPSMREGVPANVRMLVEVSFRLF